MAKPRVFISSTFFDLRQVRTDLERFIHDMGYTPVRNETGGIPYGKEQKLEEYCYKEISEIDILVGIVGGRFGSKSETGDYSITQTEIKTAIEQNKQIYIFVEKSVLSEYETYLINKDNTSTKYRFADDVRIYKFIEEIYSLPKNNIMHPFETAQDITEFLREQWAGLFRDLLSQQSRKNQYENINQKVSELTVVAGTIQTYLESVLENVTKEKEETEILIKGEKEKIEQFHFEQNFLKLEYINHLLDSHDLKFENIIEGLNTKETIEDLKSYLKTLTKKEDGDPWEYGCMEGRNIRDLNRARILLGKTPYEKPLAETE